MYASIVTAMLTVYTFLKFHMVLSLLAYLSGDWQLVIAAGL